MGYKEEEKICQNPSTRARLSTGQVVKNYGN